MKDLVLLSGQSCFLGIDAGSTTTKVALVGEDGTLLIFFLPVTITADPLGTTISVLSKRFIQLLPDECKDRTLLLYRLW